MKYIQFKQRKTSTKNDEQRIAYLNKTNGLKNFSIRTKTNQVGAIVLKTRSYMG